MKRHSLSDEQWALVADLMPGGGCAGRPWSNHRLIVDGILWIHATGAPWRDLPERFGPWKTVYERFRRWTQESFWDQLLERLQVHRHADGEIDWELFCIDGSVVRAHKAAAGAGKKRTSQRTVRPCFGPIPGGIRHKVARRV